MDDGNIDIGIYIITMAPIQLIWDYATHTHMRENNEGKQDLLT